MNTQGERWAYPEGVVDTGIVMPSCFDNPLKDHSIAFISEALRQERRAVIPVSVVLGAYHIATRYLRVPRMTARMILQGILESGSPALHPNMTPRMAVDALDYASTYGVESWDGYLISLARSLGSTVVFSLDRELAKVREITVVNPFPEEDVRRYHEFIEARMR